MRLLIKAGRVVDPANKIDAVTDILIEDNKIALVDEQIKIDTDLTIEAQGKIVMPGIIDMHVHLREPGREDKETVASGTAAALRGGVTTLLAMPNTTPAIDNPQTAALLKEIINRTAQAGVLLAGAITKDRLGKELVDIPSLKKVGVVALSDDGSSVDSDELMFMALKRAKREGILIICHSEDKGLSAQGVVNLGLTSTRLGLRGISCESEYKRVERDIKLAEKAGAAVHIAHVSCRKSVDIIAKAKQRGVRVTAETAPHYFTFTEEAVLGYDTNMKMNPPLRSLDDLAAIKEALHEGIIDVIASDHAPHTENEKEIEFVRAEFGVVGLQTELSAAVSELIEPGILGWPGLVEKLSVNPARILGLKKGSLCVGSDADLVVVDPQRVWQVGKEALVSRSKNSAFLGKVLKGRVEYTIYNGKVVYARSA
ncbi:MAG: dihydroorotase [Candidatus Omnitrophica bacterium]|nr:dihydroorotase [Candidatus Omnitrophota bacterium]